MFILWGWVFDQFSHCANFWLNSLNTCKSFRTPAHHLNLEYPLLGIQVDVFPLAFEKLNGYKMNYGYHLWYLWCLYDGCACHALDTTNIEILPLGRDRPIHKRCSTGDWNCSGMWQDLTKLWILLKCPVHCTGTVLQTECISCTFID